MAPSRMTRVAPSRMTCWIRHIILAAAAGQFRSSWNTQCDLMGTDRLYLMGTSKLHVMGTGRLHMMGTGRLHMMGTGRLHVMGTGGLHVMGTSGLLHLMGTGEAAGRAQAGCYI